MARFALDTILLGRLGEIRAGDEVPDSFLTFDGSVEKTNFARLEELGLVATKKPAPAPAAEAPAAEAPAEEPTPAPKPKRARKPKS